MQYGTINEIDKPISRLVQGTVMVNSSDIEGSFVLLDEVFELGCTTFDTGHVYGNGDNERTVGRWINERGLRDKVVILGKGAHHNRDRKRVTPFDITADIHDSLARFKTDYIDLYLLHRDDPDVPVGPIIETLNEHFEAGRIRAFGGSNWTYERIIEANTYADSHGLVPFAVSSPNFSLADQIKEPWADCISLSGPRNRQAQTWYSENQMPLFVWSSLAGGFFSDRFTRDNLDSFDDYYDRLCVESYCYEDNFKRLDRTRELAEEKGLTVPQIAMAYVMNQPMNIFGLVGCRTGAEYKANAEAADLALSTAELAWLDLRSESR